MTPEQIEEWRFALKEIHKDSDNRSEEELAEIDALCDLALKGLQAEEFHKTLDEHEISRHYSLNAGKLWVDYTLAERLKIVLGANQMMEKELEQAEALKQKWEKALESLALEEIENDAMREAIGRAVDYLRGEPADNDQERLNQLRADLEKVWRREDAPRATEARIDRGDAVNLAMDWLENRPTLTPKGIQALCNAVMLMDKTLSSRPAIIEKDKP